LTSNLIDGGKAVRGPAVVNERVARIGILFACVGCLALFVAAVQVHLPWLAAEHRRLEPWKVPVVWMSEAIGLLSFVGYTISVALPAGPRPRTPGKFAVRVVLLGACLDAAFSGWSLAAEYLAHGRAVRVPAEVVAGKARETHPGHTTFTFTCTFRDPNGGVHAAWFPLVRNADVPVPVQQAIVGGQLPAAIDVLYDPECPGRTWLADVEYSDDGRVYFYSLMSLFCSTLLAFPLAGWGAEYRYLPPPATGPFLMMVVFLGLAGLFQGGW
jgi:Protein of unknown function (DUF3592)